MRFAALLATLGTGCTLLPTEIDGRVSAVPDRGVAPWRPETLEVCLGDDCDAGARVRGADVRWDGEAFRVLGEVDGELFAGELTARWHLELDPAPVLSATQPWHAGGLRDPGWVDDSTFLFAVADDSAVGFAELGATSSTHLWDAVDLGAVLLSDPSAVERDGRIGVAAAVDEQRIVLAWADDLASLDDPRAELELADVESEGWRDIETLTDPSLDLTNDGLVGLFFSAAGRETEEQPGVPAPVNPSVGYAASRDGEVFEPFAGNPVHDRAFSFLFHAEETEPSVARDGERAIMLYRDTTDAGATLGIAVHELD